MGRADAWKFCSRRTKAERRNERSKVYLWDAAITKKTQERYYLGLAQLLPQLTEVESLIQIDEITAAWIERCWEEGESLHIVNDALCGLHHYQPWTRGHLAISWRLFKVWRKVEAPNRAPPLTQPIVYAMAMYALAHNNIVFASMLLLGFFGLLRTGELLQICCSDLLVGPKQGIISLRNTKTGLRNAAQETVAFEDDLALEVIRALIEIKSRQVLHKVPIWTKSAQAFRNEFAHHCKKFLLEEYKFRPYSLRRGGATHLFQMTGSMEMALLKGRWSSTKVAKIYLSDGLSYLPGLTFSKDTRKLLKLWDPINQLR